MTKVQIGRAATLLAMVAVLSGGAGAQADLEVAMRAAIELETVKGDLPGAIEQYRKIAAGTDRALAAQALLRMADAYQKRGDDEAQRIYQRIMREYADQTDAATIARARIGKPADVTVRLKGDRAVWTGPEVDMFGTISPDGRLLSYVDWNGAQNVMLRDLVTNASRPITGNTTQRRLGVADFSAISRDGTQIAYWWSNGSEGELRIASLNGNDTHSARVVRSGEYVRPFDWSPDGRSIAALVNENQIAVVSVEDGALRRLKSSDWQGISFMAFSPDGRYIAYDLASADRRGRMDIMVMAIDASREVAIVADGTRNYLMGWSMAGDLVFSSDRSGTRSLWTLRVENGRAHGEPRLVKQNVRATIPLGLTPSGTLYVYQPASPGYVGVASFDAIQGKIVGSAAQLAFQQYVEERARPQWSSDSRSLLFFSCGPRNYPCSMFIRDGDTAPREVPHGMWYFASASLAPGGQTLVASGSNLKGRRGVFLINVRTGETSVLTPRLSAIGGAAEWSSDGTAIRYVEARGADLVMLERRISNEQSRELFRTANDDVRFMKLSPDGRMVGYLQRRRTASEGRTVTFVVAPVDGGQARVLSTLPGFTQWWQWAADSRTVIVQKNVGDGIEVWRLPLSGSPEKLDVDGRQWTSFHISPDGKKIAFAARAGKSGNEVWALENFLPERRP